MKSQTFGEKLKELRLDLNYTLKYVGEEISYNPRLLSKVEKNEKQIPEHLIKPLAKLYQTSYKKLMLRYLSEKIYYNIRTSDYAAEALEIVKKRLKKEGKGTQIEKSKEVIFESIKTYFSTKPVEKAWVFGSFAHKKAISKDSDIDILVTFKKPHKITLFDIIQMKEELSLKTGREIDLVEEGQELQSIKQIINQERILVYAS